MTRRIALAALTAAAAGCADAPATLEATATAQGEMAWTAADDPARFGGELVYTLAELPTTGEARRIPWAGNYWPTYQDGYNHRWAGDEAPSVMEKWGTAFGVDGLEDAASEAFGIAGQSDRTACTEDSQCDAKIGEKCAKRRGEDSGHCVPTWFGVCHAWAPAAVLFDEPQRPVTRNGVEFAVQDLKALATLLAEDVEVEFVSERCDADDAAGKITYDAYGRPQSACIDTNPATWHLLLANVIGIEGQSFVEDRTFDDEVWNQPLRGYRVVESKDIGAAEANRLVGVPPVGGVDRTEQGALAEGAWQHFEPVALAAGEAIDVELSGTGDLDLYLRAGSAPTSGSHDCRPYLDGSAERCRYVAKADETVYIALNGYAAGDYTLRTVGGGVVPADYRFNDAAVAWRAVTTEVDFIAESPAGLDGNLADRIDTYTHTDRYTYVLELDAEGRLIGGEWTGESKRNHPDFVWLPTRVTPDAELLGGLIDRDAVLSMLAESVAADRPSAPQVVEEAGEVATGAWMHFGPYVTLDGLTATLTGDGDADLYVRRGAAPTADAYDCRPYEEGSAEDCALDGEGEIYVAVHGYAASRFALTVKYATAATFAGLDAQGDVARDAWAHYTVPVRAGQVLLAETAAAADVDLYVRMDAAPTAATYDGRGYTESGNEAVTYTATRDGVLHVAVHGYAASAYRLTVTENEK